jgi:hypothetical protein
VDSTAAAGDDAAPSGFLSWVDELPRAVMRGEEHEFLDSMRFIGFRYHVHDPLPARVGQAVTAGSDGQFRAEATSGFSVARR